jgi:hypothetical protein
VPRRQPPGDPALSTAPVERPGIDAANVVLGGGGLSSFDEVPRSWWVASELCLTSVVRASRSSA